MIVCTVRPEVPVLIVSEEAAGHGTELRTDSEALFAQIANDVVVVGTEFLISDTISQSSDIERHSAS
jgi:hypothetical protein